MVDIFEKIESLDRKRPGLVSKAFSTHPPTGDRIVTVQKNIQELLKEQPQYVVTTSEFESSEGSTDDAHESAQRRYPRSQPSDAA